MILLLVLSFYVSNLHFEKSGNFYFRKTLLTKKNARMKDFKLFANI